MLRVSTYGITRYYFVTCLRDACQSCDVINHSTPSPNVFDAITRSVGSKIIELQVAQL
jgi:hypothetical protein